MPAPSPTDRAGTSTGYVDKQRKTFGGAVHVVSNGSQRARQYSLRLTGPSSQRTYDSAAFVASPAGSDGDLSVASLHYNGLFDSVDDLAPSAVLVAENGTSTNGSAALVQLGATFDSTAAWGLFETLPSASSSLARRSTGSDECTAAASAGSARKANAKSGEAKAGRKDDEADARKSSKAVESKQRTSKAQAAKDGIVIIQDRRCRVVSRSDGKSTSSVAKAAKASKTIASSSSSASKATGAVVGAASAAQVISTGAIANTATPAAAAATSLPPTLSGVVVGPQTPEAATSTPAADAAQPTATDAASPTIAAAAEQPSESAFQLPGRQLNVLPVGLGVTGGVSVLALGIVGFVSWERRRYRKQFRSRKMCV